MAAGYLAAPYASRRSVPTRTAGTFKCLTFAAFLTLIYLCSIFFTLLYHLANHMRLAYAVRP